VADSFHIEVATPERLLVDEEAVRSQIPTPDGYIGVWPDHAALLSELGVGVLAFVNTSDHRFAVAVKQGFVEVRDNHVRVVADEAEFGGEIDSSEAERALRHAETNVISPSSAIDIAGALIELRHAQARIDAARQAANPREAATQTGV